MINTEFNKEQFDAIYPIGIENHYWTLSRNKIIKKELEKNGLINNRILEIGCGRGIVVNFLRESGFDCYGVELAEIESIEGIEDYVITGTTFESLDNDLITSIEVIMLLDIIEHIKNDVEFISKINNFFPNLKCLIITVPTRKELFSNYDTYYGHYRRYGNSEIFEVADRGGLYVKRLSYFFHFLYLPAILLSMFNIKRNIKILPPKGIKIYIHKMLAMFFYLDYLLLPGKIFGTSMICSLYNQKNK